jgi:glycosyltransferase involved in cell wall biosynthesis
MAKIQIFIATYNRPSFVVNCIKSVLAQSFTNFELTVSDNSTDNKTTEVVSNFKDDRLTYIKREPTLSGNDHLNTILNEITGDYFMIFHDDDLMHYNMLEVLYNTLVKNEHAIAVGSNAFFTINGKKTKDVIFKNSKNNLILKNNLEIVKQYLIRHGIVPFPSYLYKKDVSQKFRLDERNGANFCDMAFIMEIATLGHVIFLSEPLMDYYIHTENDHVPDFFSNNMKIINFIRKTTDMNKNNNLIKKFRIKSIYMELKQGILCGRISLFSKRYLTLLFIIFRSSFSDYFPRILIITILCFFNISTSKMKVTSNVPLNI